MTRRIAGLHGALAAALIASVIVGCGGGSGADKSGGDAAPVTLRMATPEEEGAPYTEAVKEFARQVESLSGGSLRIDIVWDGPREYFGSVPPGAEQKLAGLLRDGKKMDAALIPARAWDEVGVTSLQALQAPFLVSTEELVAQVTQGDVGKEMLAGLDKAGVVGLTLLPEGLRHPVGFERPLLNADDFAGKTLRVPPSGVTNRLLEAVGAKPVDLCCDELFAAVEAGEIAGAESGFAWAGTLPRPGTFTANITLYPKVNAIVVNDDAFARISDEQRKILREAAGRAQRSVIQNAPGESQNAEQYCGIGGRIAFASRADLASLERAAQPVYTVLEQDPGTKAFIERIRAIKASREGPDPALPAACTASQAEPEPAPETEKTATFPEGVYRADLPAEHLIAKGMDPPTAHQLAGLITLAIKDGRWLGHTRGIPGNCGGPYTVKAGRISLTHDVAQCGAPAGTEVVNARWKLEDGGLVFYDFRVGRPIEWGSKPWTKID